MLCAHTVVFDNKLEVVFDENDDESVMSLMQDCLHGMRHVLKKN